MFTFAIVHFTDCILYVLGFVPYLIYSLLFQNKERFFCFPHKVLKFCFYLGFFFSLIYLFFFTLQYCIGLPYINMNPPQVYTCSPSWTPLPPPSPTIPLGHLNAPAPSILYPASNLDWRLVSYMILYMFQCHSPNHPTLSLSHRVQKTVLYICVSFAVLHTGLSLPSF